MKQEPTGAASSTAGGIPAQGREDVNMFATPPSKKLTCTPNGHTLVEWLRRLSGSRYACPLSKAL